MIPQLLSHTFNNNNHEVVSDESTSSYKFGCCQYFYLFLYMLQNLCPEKLSFLS